MLRLASSRDRDNRDRVSAELMGHGAADLAAPWRSRAWGIVGALSITETVSWGIVYYAFAVFLVPMQRELGFSTAQLTGAFSLALLISAVAGIAVGRYLDRHSPRGLMTAGSIAATALVLAWSRLRDLAALYVLWAALGVVMATVLYEPAFTVLAKWFPGAAQRRALILGAITIPLHAVVLRRRRTTPPSIIGTRRRSRPARRCGPARSGCSAPRSSSPR
jgi:hypothetical protein